MTASRQSWAGGLTGVRLEFTLDTDADAATRVKLLELSERYCVVAQTVRTPPPLEVTLVQE